MLIIREKIRFNSLISGGTMNLKFPLGSNDDFLGYQQEIDNLTQVNAISLVNPVVDAETKRFKLNSLTPTTLDFQFNNGTYQSLFTSNGFTNTEINGNSLSFLNSFFILDFYDTYDINSQTKIFTTYLTKLKKSTDNKSTYPINATNQLFYWYVPISYMTDTICFGYIKFSFFNAKYGITTLFFNNDNVNLTTPEKMFFKVELNRNDKTWKIISPYSTIIAKQIIV